MMLTLVGKGMSPGLAKGTAYIYRGILQQGCAPYEIDATQVRAEQVRIKKALEDVRQRLTIDATHTEEKLGKESADIFRAQEMMLCSPSTVEELEKTLQAERLNAEEVVRSVFRGWTHRFREMSDEVLRERGDDVDDLSRRLLSSLAGTHAHSLENLPANTVLIASRLLPSDTVFLSRNSTVAVLEEFASPAAHAALLAGELGIPYVSGIPKLVATVHTGDIVLVDSIKETAVINPNARVRQTFEESLDEVRKRKKTIQGNCMKRAVTKDGIEMSVMANVRSREDVELALNGGADGIGMLRTEPFFLSTQHFPSDKEFASFIIDSLQPAQGKHVEIRLLDIGADKNPHYLHLPSEPDPFLGQRGVRLLLGYPDVLEAQLRAMLEVSKHFRIGVLIPMVTTESDVTRVAQRIRAMANNMGICKLPRIGAMLETPAAALSIPSLRKHVDFFSIGSNDLTQYTMAAGRENPLVTEYFLDDHPAMLRLIELAVSESGDTPMSLCGELAGRTDAMPRLLAAGVRSLSVPAPLVSEVKSAIRNINTSARVRTHVSHDS